MSRYNPLDWDHLTDEDVVKHKRERIELGMSTFDWWNADEYIAQVIVDTCQRFIDGRHGHPGDMTDLDWEQILVKMRDGFQDYLDMAMQGAHDDEEKNLSYKEAMLLFVEYHRSLWD